MGQEESSFKMLQGKRQPRRTRIEHVALTATGKVISEVTLYYDNIVDSEALRQHLESSLRKHDAEAWLSEDGSLPHRKKATSVKDSKAVMWRIDRLNTTISFDSTDQSVKYTWTALYD